MTSKPHIHRPRKRFGQNFLCDKQVIHRIIQMIAPKESDHFVEIGPGRGALTEVLQGRCHCLELVEIDRDLVGYLENKFPDLTIHSHDALSFDFADCVIGIEPLRIIGNLPYNISTPLLFHLMSFTPVIQDMHFMLQKEVAERICAQAGDKRYGRLSVMLQYHCQVKLLFNVAKEAFYPKPKVQSAILRLTPYSQLPHPVINHQLFFNVVRAAFAYRRKITKNALQAYLTIDDFKQLALNPQLRPEQLTIADYVAITNYVDNKS